MIRLGLDDYRPAREPEKRTLTLSDFPGLATYLETSSSAGVVVNENTANGITAYFCAINVISSQVALRARPVYRRLENDDREKATTHPVYKLMEIEPNPRTTPFVFWRTLMVHALGWGNGYAEIEWDRSDRPIGLHLILPDRISPYIDNNRLFYKYAGSEKPILPEDIIHIPGLGFDGLQGYSPAQIFRRSLGMFIAAEEFCASFLRNGASASLAIQHPGTLSDSAQRRIRESIQSRHGGVKNAGGILITEEGMKIEQIGIAQKEAQFQEGRDFGVLEVARIFNIHPRKLKLQSGEAPTTPEAGQIEFLTDTLQPWLVGIEQECNRKLFPASQRGKFYVEHLVDDMLRMDGASRASSYKAYLDMGVMTAEQIAKKENLPPPENTAGEMALVDKVNAVGQLVRAGFEPEGSLSALGLPAIPHTGLVPITVKEEEPAAQSAPMPQPLLTDGRMLAAQRALVVEAMGQFIRAEANEARRAAKKGLEAFGAWVEEFYSRKSDILAGSLAPLVEFELARRGQAGDSHGVARTLAVGHAERSRDELLDLRKDELEGQVDRLMEKWKLIRPGEMADRIASIGRESDAA